MEKERTITSIRHWSVNDKPREKLMLKGNQALSDAELLAILIGSGSRNETAVDLSKRILADQQNNLNQLARLSLSDLQKFKGIGEAKAITIMAALELGKRRRLEEALELPKVTDSRTVYELLQPLMGDLNHEEFWIVYLNQSNKIVGKWLASKGGITSTMVDVRLVLKKALELMATGLILSHNHPSGKREPSQSDKDLTRKMIDAAKVMDIQVLDHLIVTEKSYFSFADEGIL
ncbi:MAG: DNA repair protein RadC [Flavobacteriaceae bacterium]|jgi:DNA repair protein RadC|nr:DNA repair protein RadC [Flavobacteriaceae bacterium]